MCRGFHIFRSCQGGCRNFHKPLRQPPSPDVCVLLFSVFVSRQAELRKERRAAEDSPLRVPRLKKRAHTFKPLSTCPPIPCSDSRPSHCVCKNVQREPQSIADVRRQPPPIVHYPLSFSLRSDSHTSKGHLMYQHTFARLCGALRAIAPLLASSQSRFLRPCTAHTCLTCDRPSHVFLRPCTAHMLVDPILSFFYCIRFLVVPKSLSLHVAFTLSNSKLFIASTF